MNDERTPETETTEPKFWQLSPRARLSRLRAEREANNRGAKKLSDDFDDLAVHHHADTEYNPID
jgi:hypothetical protein